MADETCVCNYPIWMYDENDEEYFALPIDVAEERGIQIRKDLGDLEVIVNRDGRDIKFLAIPFKTVETRNIDIPEFETVDHDVLVGNDVIVKQFLKVTWQKVIDEIVKKYDLRGHIVIAGCKPSEMVKELGFDDLLGQEKEILRCSGKLIFVVFHPIDEFLEGHILELRNKKVVPKEVLHKGK